MKSGAWFVVVLVVATGVVVLAVSLRTESTPSSSDSARPGQYAAEEGTRSRLEDPTALEAETEPTALRPPPETASDTVVEANLGSERTLAATVEWLKRVLPDRFAALTVNQALALEELDLRGAVVADEDLWRLATLPNLSKLGLRGTAVTDDGLGALRALELTSLDLRGTSITGRGLVALNATSLTALHLTDTKVTRAELARMPNLPALSTLKLNDLGIGDSAVESLSIYRGLRHVELDGTTLTDAGLERLFELHPGLTRIEARRTGVSGAAVAAARQAHPGCEIVVD